jgi:hypothetical protein
MAGGQGGGGRGNRPFTGGLGNGMGGGPAYGQQQRTGPQMPSQATYQQNAPYPGGFAPAAPGAQMMQAGQATPYQMNYGSQARQPLPMNGGQMPSQRQFNQYMQQWQQQHRRPGQPAPGTPAVTPPVTDPATGNPVVTDPSAVDPNIGHASDVYGHVVGDGTDGGDPGVTPDPITGQPRKRHSALAQQIAALRGRIEQRHQNILGKGYGAIGTGDPKIDAMRARLHQMFAQRSRGGGGPGNAA